MPTMHDEVMFNGMRLGKGLSFLNILTSHLISDLSLLSGLMIACHFLNSKPNPQSR